MLKIGKGIALLKRGAYENFLLRRGNSAVIELWLEKTFFTKLLIKMQKISPSERLIFKFFSLMIPIQSEAMLQFCSSALPEKACLHAGLEGDITIQQYKSSCFEGLNALWFLQGQRI